MRFDANDSSATTDPNGEYTIDTLEPGEKTFTFSRSGYIAQQKTVTVAGGKDARLDVQMSTGMRVTGFVVTDGGAPIADATVRAMSASEMDGGRSGRSDTNGAYTIEGLAPGHYTFNAAKNGYSAGTLRDVDIATSGPVRIVLKSGGVITGHVNGLTRAGARTDHGHRQRRGRRRRPGPMGGSTAPVDSGGNFRIEGAPSGTVRISARTGAMFGGSSKSAAPKTVELEPGGTAQVDIDFKSSTIIRGRVTRNGAAVPNAQVMFIPRGAKSQTSASASADADGRYELSGLDDGTYTVQAMDMERLNPFATQYEVHGSGTFDIAIKTVDAARPRGRCRRRARAGRCQRRASPVHRRCDVRRPRRADRRVRQFRDRERRLGHVPDHGRQIRLRPRRRGRSSSATRRPKTCSSASRRATASPSAPSIRATTRR